MARDPEVGHPAGELPDAYQGDDARTPVISDAQCFFIYGPRGRAKVIVNTFEAVPDPDGQRAIRAVHVRCPKCGSRGRVTTQKPFRIDEGRKVFETEHGSVPLGPLLTIESPYECGAHLVVEDEARRRAEAVCDFHAVIRRGIAYDLPDAQNLLTMAMGEANLRYREALGLYQRFQSRLPAQARAVIESDLQTAAAMATAVCPVIERGEYERGGPQSVVGCWDTVDFIAFGCRKIAAGLAQVGGTR